MTTFLNSVTQPERDQNPTEAGTEQIKNVRIVLPFKGQRSTDAVRKTTERSWKEKRY